MTQSVGRLTWIGMCWRLPCSALIACLGLHLPCHAAGAPATPANARPVAALSGNGVAPDAVWQAQFKQLVALAEDRPQAALLAAERALALPHVQRDATAATWMHLARAAVLQIAEMVPAIAPELALAERRYANVVAPSAVLSVHMALMRLAALPTETPYTLLMQRTDALEASVRASGDHQLLCDWWVLSSARRQLAGDIDRAWQAAEAGLRCAKASGDPLQLGEAHRQLGDLAYRIAVDEAGQQLALQQFDLARSALANTAARYRLSVVEWNSALAHANAQHWAKAEQAYSRCMKLALELGDALTADLVRTQLAGVYLKLKQPQAAWDILPTDLRSTQSAGAYWVGAALNYRLDTMIALGKGGVVALAQQWRGLLSQLPPGSERAMVMQAFARAHAAEQDFGLALRWLRQAQVELEGESGQARDDAVVRLVARHEQAQVEAQAALLRERTVQAQASLTDADARAQTARAVLLGVALLLTLGSALAWRQWQRQRQQAALALRDELTGCLNRRAIMAYAKAQAEQAQRLHLPLAVAMLDIDHFKRINDSFGHAVGDSVLKAFAQCCQGQLRGQDRLGRVGGEEWLLVLPGFDHADAAPLFDRLREALAAAPIEGLPQPHGLAFSMGVAAVHSDLNAALDASDQALYAAKREGRNRWRLAVWGAQPLAPNAAVAAWPTPPPDQAPAASPSTMLAGHD